MSNTIEDIVRDIVYFEIESKLEELDIETLVSDKVAELLSEYATKEYVSENINHEIVNGRDCDGTPYKD